MYRGYEAYWSAMRADPTGPSPMTGTIPTAGELAWCKRIPSLPHFVLSRLAGTSAWENTRFRGDPSEIAALKSQTGKSIYLMGGGAMFNELMRRKLVDELRLIVHPLTAGGPHDLFVSGAERQPFRLLASRQMEDGLLRLDYAPVV